MLQVWNNLLETFLAALAARPASADCANPYAGRASEVRRRNLRRHLGHLRDAAPSVVLVGEAPGYRGCAVTGVPFTSRALFDSDLGRWGLFRPLGLECPPDLGEPGAELSATVLWTAATAHLPGPPVTWNAFPFHPHRPHERSSNRSLRPAEIVEGGAALRALLELFPSLQVVAVGRRAEHALAGIGYSPLAMLRHPAHGGASAFQAGIARLAQSLPAR